MMRMRLDEFVGEQPEEVEDGGYYEGGRSGWGARPPAWTRPQVFHLACPFSLRQHCLQTSPASPLQ